MVNKSYYEKLGGFNVKENCMKKILVTGGTTFVSKYVAEYFVNAGYEVFVLNRNSKPQVQGVTLIEDGLKDSAKWYLEHSTEVNKKPYFEYIDENLAED